MRTWVLVFGLGLVVVSRGLAGENDWVELTYEEPYCWVLDVPGLDGGRELYELSWPAPVDGVARAYVDCRVLEYDEDALTLTLECPGSEEVIVGFECLLEWLDGDPPATAGAVHSSFPVGVTCAGGSCACEGKCWACCAEGFVPSCHCGGTGVCKCVAVDSSVVDDPVY